MAEFRLKIAREIADSVPVSLSRLGLELESALVADTCYVCDVDSGKAMDPLMSFGGDDKQYFGTGPNILGWGMAAAFGVKLARARPAGRLCGWRRQFLFSGPQPLWSQARYQAPITNIVLNNKSYNNERNRIWHYAGRQFKTGRDMTCYNGSPDVDFVKAAGAFGVEGEVVKEPGDVKAAIGRAQARRCRRAARTCSMFTHCATASAPPRPGIRPTRSPRTAAGRFDATFIRHSHSVHARCACARRAHRCRVCARAGGPTRALPAGEGRDIAATRVLAMPRPQRHHVDARRAHRDGAVMSPTW